MMYVLQGSQHGKIVNPNMSSVGRVSSEDLLMTFLPGLLEMFLRTPLSDREDNKKTWHIAHANNVAQMIDSYQRLEPDSMIVDGETEYAEWDGEHNGDKGKFFGMRHRETGKPHGLIRFVRENGWIYECTYKLGERHGLQIYYYSSDKVNVWLYKNDSLQARFSFDRNFKETGRDGSALDYLSPGFFNPNESNP